MARVRKAVFPVGGLGTRFLPATKSMPKEMLPVVDKPLIQYAFEEARAAGIEQFIFITGRNKSIINNHFDHAYELQEVLSEAKKQEQLSLTKDWLPPAGHVAFIRQQEPMGLGHAIWCARHFVGREPFAVLLADEMLLSKEPILDAMIKAHDKTEGNIIAVAEVPREKISQYGIIQPGKDGDGIIEIHGMVEKPDPEKAPSNLSIVGRYILQPEIMRHLEKQQRGKGGEIQLTDAMSEMLKDRPFHGVRFTGQRFDCGSKIGYLEASIAYALRHPELAQPMKELLMRYSKAD